MMSLSSSATVSISLLLLPTRSSSAKNVLYVNVFKKNDKRTIYNVAYRDGKEGTTYVKRFAVTSVVRDREYDVTQGTPESRITYFSANPNGEAEIIKGDTETESACTSYHFRA